MDEIQQHIRRQLSEALTTVVDQGVASIGAGPVVELLKEFIFDIDAGGRPTCEFSEDGGSGMHQLTYSSPLGLERDVEKFTQVGGVMVEVEPVPPLMEEIGVTVCAVGVEQRVGLDGRAVHVSREGVALELLVEDDQLRERLDDLVHQMREVELQPSTGQRASTTTSTLGPGSPVSEVVEELMGSTSSVVVDDEDEVPATGAPAEVDQLLDVPDKPGRSWSLETDDVAEILLEVAAIDGYGVLELSTSGTRRQYLTHFGSLIDVRRRPRQDIEEVLVRQLVALGYVDAEDLERAQVVASIHEISRQDALIDMGCITVDELLEAIRGRLIKTLDDLWARSEGRLRFFALDQRPALRLRRTTTGLVAAVVRRIRRRLRGLSSEELTRQMKRYSNRQIQRTPSPSLAVEELGLDDRQRRFVDTILDEPRSLSELERVSNLQDEETRRMLLFLDELELLSVSELKRSDPRIEELKSLRTQFRASNHFEVLGIHWSAYDEEVERAYDKLRNRLDVPPGVEEKMGEELDELRRTLSKAYAALSDSRRRRSYREQEIDEFSRKNGLQIYERKAEGYEMRSDKGDLVDCLKRIVELNPNDGVARKKLEALQYAMEQRQE